jgi:sugar/nucleoside kinase (ribokinase family)
MTRPDHDDGSILVCGESLVDLLPTRCRDETVYVPRPGGSPYNVAVALAWLGPGEEVEHAGRRWLDLGAALVVISLGAEGALGIWPGGTVRGPGLTVDVADTVGAGDSFTAGLLASLHGSGLLRRELLERLSAAKLDEALTYASRVAAITCTRVGADPPTATRSRIGAPPGDEAGCDPGPQPVKKARSSMAIGPGSNPCVWPSSVLYVA